MSKVLIYVCQRAAHTILSETDTHYISTDGLQAINTFLDEFLFILLNMTQSVDLHYLKSTVQKLLPSTLGRNALLEADIELKSLLDSSFDFSAYEASQQRPLEIASIQEACAHHCTLSDHKFQSGDVIVIYLAAIVEHLAEYVLISIANQAENDHVRVKDVWASLVNDTKVNLLFQRMCLKEQLQKKVSIYLNTSLLSIHNSLKTDSSSSIHSSRRSMESDISQKSSKRRFSFFSKKNRNSMYISFPQPQLLPSPHPSPLATDFEDLFQSGQTKKVSLTPNRLKSIEISPPSPTLTPVSSLSSRPKLPTDPIEKPVIKRNSICPQSFFENPSGDLVYVIPSFSPCKANSADRACQTDPLDEEEEEEWFIDDDELVAH